MADPKSGKWLNGRAMLSKCLDLYSILSNDIWKKEILVWLIRSRKFQNVFAGDT